MIRRLALAALLFILLAGAASAHMTPNSVISLDFGSRVVDAEIVIPMGELAYATGSQLNERNAVGPMVQRYVRDHVAARTMDGRDWMVALDSVSVRTDGRGADIIARLKLTPPAGAPLRDFTLGWNGVIDRVPNHYVLVFARSDFLAGALATDSPELIGGLQGRTTSLHVTRKAASLVQGIGASIRLGMTHIIEGQDHLLFLIVLLLPAPLLIRGHRWDGYAGLRPMLVRLGLIVSAFTLGHSVTLIGGAFFGWRLPARPIEVAIALTILASAVHAWRPVFRGREPWLAAGFGLIHGLAFASVIGSFQLEVLHKALAIFGFNLGIEIAQVGVILAVMPLMLLLAPTPTYATIRIGGALFAAIAALAWASERVTGARNGIQTLVDLVLADAPWLIAAMTLVAVAIRVLQARAIPRQSQPG